MPNPEGVRDWVNFKVLESYDTVLEKEAAVLYGIVFAPALLTWVNGHSELSVVVNCPPRSI